MKNRISVTLKVLNPMCISIKDRSEKCRHGHFAMKSVYIEKGGWVRYYLKGKMVLYKRKVNH